MQVYKGLCELNNFVYCILREHMLKHFAFQKNSYFGVLLKEKEWCFSSAQKSISTAAAWAKQTKQKNKINKNTMDIQWFKSGLFLCCVIDKTIYQNMNRSPVTVCYCRRRRNKTLWAGYWKSGRALFFARALGQENCLLVQLDSVVGWTDM